MKPYLHKAVKRLACLSAATITMTCAAGTTTIGFDDLRSSLTGITNGYNGLLWNNFNVINATTESANPNDGFINGLVSANNVAYNRSGNPASISSAGAFNLDSAYLTAAWLNGLQVEVQGFVGTTLTYDNTYSIDATGPSFIRFDYLGVDEINFIASGGVPYYSSSGEEFALDNLTFTIPAPEPSSLALAGAGVVALMVSRRRR